MAEWRKDTQISGGLQVYRRVHKEIRIKEAHGITSPLLYGIRRPVIVLPLGMAGAITESELKHVILHELMHCRKRDNLVWTVVFCSGQYTGSTRLCTWLRPSIETAMKNTVTAWCWNVWARRRAAATEKPW